MNWIDHLEWKCSAFVGLGRVDGAETVGRRGFFFSRIADAEMQKTKGRGRVKRVLARPVLGETTHGYTKHKTAASRKTQVD